MMKKYFLMTALLFALAAAGAELKFYLDGESRKAPGVKYFGGGIRQVPGRFGKGFLIERRTLNSFNAADVVLCDGAKLSGKNNILALPAGGFAALPLTAIRPRVPNTLSFRYRGEGIITVTFDGKTLASLKAEKTFKHGEVIVIPEEDTGSLKIRAEKAVELSHLMFDKGIGYSNTYHAPGKMRSVDRIDVNAELFDPGSGAISCWIKAPWFRKDAKHATGIALGDTKVSTKGKPLFYFCCWSNGISLITKSKTPPNNSCGFKLSEVSPAADGWNHLVFNWKLEKNTINLSIIVNGEKVFNKKGVCRGLEIPKLFTIGYVNGAYLNGILDDFGLFSGPLSKEEAKKIFSAGKPLGELYKK